MAFFRFSSNKTSHTVGQSHTVMYESYGMTHALREATQLASSKHRNGSKYCLGTLGWIRLPVLGEEKFSLHYSNPDDFQQSRSAGDLRPIEINSNQSPAEFCVYGFEAGSFRRHIRLCDINGDVIEDILLLLDIDSVRISGSFDITLGGIPSTRKIEVANPYSDERTFYLHTSNVFKRIESQEDGPLSQKSTVLCVKSGRSFINRPNE